MLNTILFLICSVNAGNILLTGEYLPYIDPNAKDLGAHSVIVKNVFQELKWKFEPKFYPWKRVHKMLQYNEAMFSYSWIKNSERELAFLYSKEPIEEIPVYIYYNVFKLNDFNRKPEIEDFKKYRSSVIAGYWQEALFKKNGIKFIVTPTLESNFKLLADGRVDFILSSQLSAKAAFSKMDKKFVKMISKMSVPFKVDQLFLVASKKNSDAKKLIQEWDIALKKYKKNNKL